MALQDDFKQTMHDVYKFSPLIGLEDQALLQSWVQRLEACAARGAGCAGSAGLQRTLDYARYLAYQLERAQLRFPFSQPPREGSLPDLKEVVFGADHLADSSLDSSGGGGSHEGRRHRSGRQPPPARPARGRHAVNRRLLQSAKDGSLPRDDSTWNGSIVAHHTSADEDALWDSHQHALWDSHQHNKSETHWESHVADPKCERDINAHLEELPADAPLWLLLTKICPHTRDGGALLHAMVAEELAEWSALLAADQTLADSFPLDEEESEEEWGPRAERRLDYWQNVSGMWRSLNSEDPQAGSYLSLKIKNWLYQQNRQLQAEQAQLNAFVEELQDVKQQVQQNYAWQESQFEEQNQTLLVEVKALKQGIADCSKEMANLKLNWREPTDNTTLSS